jgi:WD repeat-containing protein 35
MKGNLIRAKKLNVLGALEVEQYRKKLLDSKQEKNKDRRDRGTLEGLMEEDSVVSREKDLETAWRGAEAYHFFLLAQRQLYEGYIDASMKTSIRLMEYEDILEPKEIYSLVALTAYMNKFYGQCSRAFMKLETLPDGQIYQNLALEIFTKHPPADPPNKRKYECPECSAEVKDW